MAQHSILIVDDDLHLREVLRYALEQEGLAFLEANNGKDGLALAIAAKPSVMILDVMMPEMSGLDVCRELRKTTQLPILFLSSRDSEIDRILGLELGGDDYMSKPFSPRELIARIKVMLRRLDLLQQPASSKCQDKILAQNSLQLNTSTFCVTWQDHPVILTATEFNLLEVFMRTPQKVYTRDELAQADVFRDIVSDRTIDSHIRRLRQKLANAGCQNAVETVHGFGYKLGFCQQ